MLVSTFEVLFKPITPGGGPIARRVLQGYFLTISNLESKALRYRIEFHISLPNPDDPNKKLAGNHVFITDIQGVNSFLTLTNSPAGSDRYTTTFSIPAGKTALLTLLPNLTTPNFFSNPAFSQLEVRGYVSLFLPGNVLSVQSSTSVNVLLNPEYRGIFLPNDFPASTTGLDFDQTNTTLAIASGAALNLLPPEPPLIEQMIILQPDLKAVHILDIFDGAALEGDSVQRLGLLLGLLQQVGSDEKSLSQINRYLEELKTPVALTRT